MKPECINPVVRAASESPERELGARVTRGDINLTRSARTSHEVAAFLGVTGDVRGAVLYGLSDRTARAIVAKMLGADVPEFDGLAQSGIAEPGNCIT
jgi:chemotaxis protein CheX